MRLAIQYRESREGVKGCGGGNIVDITSICFKIQGSKTYAGNLKTNH